MADPLMQSPMPADPAAQMPPEAAPIEGEEAASPQDTQTFETMVAGLLEHLYGPAEKATLKQLKSAKNPATEAGNITFLLVQEAAHQAEAAQIEFDMDMLFGVATEIIDSLLKMCQAGKVKIADEEDFRAQALITAVNAYAASAPAGSEEQEQAKAMLAEMQQSGMVQEGASELQRLGAKHGVDPFAQPAPKKNAMAQGVQQGLMGAAQ